MHPAMRPRSISVIRRETTPSHVVYGLDKQHLSAITKVITGEGKTCQ